MPQTACKAEGICCPVLYIKSLPPPGPQDEVQTPHQSLPASLWCNPRLPPQPTVPQSSQAQPHQPLQWAQRLKWSAVSHFPASVRALLSTDLATQTLLHPSKTQFMFLPTRWDALWQPNLTRLPTALNSFVSQLSVYSSDSQTSCSQHHQEGSWDHPLAGSAPHSSGRGVKQREWTFLTSFKADAAGPGTAQKQHQLISVSSAPIASKFFEEGPNFIHVWIIPASLGSKNSWNTAETQDLLSVV